MITGACLAYTGGAEVHLVACCPVSFMLSGFASSWVLGIHMFSRECLLHVSCIQVHKEKMHCSAGQILLLLIFP